MSQGAQSRPRSDVRMCCDQMKPARLQLVVSLFQLRQKQPPGPALSSEREVVTRSGAIAAT